jgi:hypothetical protein
MYFFDDMYSAAIGTGELWTYVKNFYGNYWDFKDFIYTSEPDGTFGVYYSPSNFTGNTSDVQNFTSQITETSCNTMKNKFDEYRVDVVNGINAGVATFPISAQTNTAIAPHTFLRHFPRIYWDKQASKCVTHVNAIATNYGYGGYEAECCGNEGAVDFDELLTQPLSDVTTIEGFQNYLNSELIDVKSRKTITGYPTLRALYDRYVNSINYCPTNSSAFDYLVMDQFADLLDNYWVDLVEQVIPATTIWGSVKIYTNTLFDQQKFAYKKYTSIFCNSPFSGKTVSSPINGTSGLTQNLSVKTIDITPQPEFAPLLPINPIGYCGSISISQMNAGSEFIGSVQIITRDSGYYSMY